LAQVLRINRGSALGLAVRLSFVHCLVWLAVPTKQLVNSLRNRVISQLPPRATFWTWVPFLVESQLWPSQLRSWEVRRSRSIVGHGHVGERSLWFLGITTRSWTSFANLPKGGKTAVIRVCLGRSSSNWNGSKDLQTLLRSLLVSVTSKTQRTTWLGIAAIKPSSAVRFHNYISCVYICLRRSTRETDFSCVNLTCNPINSRCDFYQVIPPTQILVNCTWQLIICLCWCLSCPKKWPQQKAHP
jgi:hypothetical protein